MKRFEQRTHMVSLRRFFAFAVWRVCWKLARSEACSSVREQLQTEAMGQKVIQRDGPGQKGLESADTWEVAPPASGDGVDGRSKCHWTVESLGRWIWPGG